MKKPTVMSLLVCLNVILLIAVFRQVFHVHIDVPRSPVTVSFEHQCPTFQSQSVIRSTEESLYVMYGEGNFTDTDEHLLSYIRSMTSRQGPGGRRLSAYIPNADYSQHEG